eukprot:185274_1
MAQNSKYSTKIHWTLKDQELIKAMKLPKLSFAEGPKKHIGNVEIYLAFYPCVGNDENEYDNNYNEYCELKVGIDFDLPLVCKWKIDCPELNIHSSLTNTFDINNNEWEWGNQNVSAEKIEGRNSFNSYYIPAKKQLTFDVTIRIKCVYNHKNQQVAKNNWDVLLGISKLPIHQNIDNVSVSSLTKMISKLQNEVNILRSYVFEEKKNDNDADSKITNVTFELLSLREKYKLLHQKIETIEKKEKHGKASQKEILRLWLKETVGLEEYFYVLVKNGFDGMESVKMLTMNELNVLGIDKMGHRMKILKYIAKLNQKKSNIAYKEGDTALI